MRERRAYVITFAIAGLLAIFSILFTIQQVHASDHKFCQLISASLAGTPTPVKPKDPKANPSRERLYENFIIVQNLGHSLGCL